MRILIDASPALLRSAGVKNYLWHWIRALRAMVDPGTIRAWPLLGDLGVLAHDRSTLSAISTWPRLALLYASNLDWLPALEVMVSSSHVFHATNQVRRAPHSRTLLTATLHDLTCWFLPQFHSEANIRADHAFASNIVRKAAGVIAISERTRQDAVRHLGLAPEKITVIHNGVAAAYFDAKPGVPPKYGLGKPYVLFVGTIEPRKNVSTLLDAWPQLPESVRHEVDLVVAGPSGWRNEQALARLRAGEAGVRYLGYVPEHDLPSLTAGAAAFVYPSLYEGFGFPVAQAMAAGVPVITAGTSCLPEIAGDAALLIDPLSPAEIASALRLLLDSPDLRSRLAASGRRRAENYRWEANARKSLLFFQQVAGR